MFQVVRLMHFCYGHRLMDYAGKCRHPHGHNGTLEVELTAARLDARGMVMDFKEMKQRLQTWVDAHLDHAMVLRRDDPLVPVLEDMRERLYLLDDNPTAENMAKEIFRIARSRRLPVTRVTLWETEKSYAVYAPGRRR